MTSSHVEFVPEFGDLPSDLSEERLAVLLELSFDRLLAQKTLPSLELPKLLGGRCFAVGKIVRAKFGANLLLHRLEDILIVLHGSVPSTCLVLVGVEGIDFAEGIKC